MRAELSIFGRCVTVCLAAIWPVVASAGQEVPAAQASQDQPPSSSADEDADEQDKKAAHPHRDLLIVPLPLSRPSTGTGLALGAVMFQNPKHEPQQWVTGAGALYTDKGAKGLAFFHSMSLGQDRIRIRALAAYTDARAYYYGIGGAAGEAGQRRIYDNRDLQFQLQAQVRVLPHTHLGLRWRFADSRWKNPRGDVDQVAAPPGEELDSTLSMIGPTVSYDTRDSALQPHSGTYAAATWLVGAGFLGNSFGHTRLQVLGNWYVPMRKTTVLATRVATCAVTGHVPFNNLCDFGSGADLRGYESGRYRDRASWAAQAEVRQHLGGRFGGVAFFGVGGIAPSFGDVLDDSTLLPSAGVGVRYQPFRKNDVNLRLDVAVGWHGPGVYLGIAEAF